MKWLLHAHRSCQRNVRHVCANRWRWCRIRVSDQFSAELFNPRIASDEMKKNKHHQHTLEILKCIRSKHNIPWINIDSAQFEDEYCDEYLTSVEAHQAVKTRTSFRDYVLLMLILTGTLMLKMWGDLKILIFMEMYLSRSGTPDLDTWKMITSAWQY